MKHFTALAFALVCGIASGQGTNLTASVPPAPVPSAPAGSPPDVAQLIGDIPSCWTSCVGGAIKEVCPLNDTWTCACNNYFNVSAANFNQIASYDPACSECSTNVGPSDGAEQDITGLLVNICIALLGPAPSTTSTMTTTTAASTSTSPTKSSSTLTSAASSQPTKNASAAAFALEPLPWLLVAFVTFGSLALL